VLLGMLLVGGVGVAMLSGGEDEPDAHGSAESPGVADALPGGSYPQGPPGPNSGTIGLSLAQSGGATVIMTDALGFRFVWDGTGNVELGGMKAGSYRSKVAPKEGEAIRGTLDVQAGLSCVYSWDLRGGEQEWMSRGCFKL
jgi:hypothetical protein